MTSLNYHGFMKINPATTITDSLSAKYCKKSLAIAKGKNIRENIKNIILVNKVNTVKSMAACLGIKETNLYPILSSMEKSGDIQKSGRIAEGRTIKSNIYTLVEK